MLGRIRVPYKLLLIFLLDMVTVVYLVHVVVQEADISIDFARKERLGVLYLRPLSQVTMAVARLSPASDGDSAAQAARIDALGALIQLTATDRKLGTTLATAPIAQSAIAALSNLAMAPPGNNLALSRIAATRLRSLFQRVGDSSKLILDPELDSYYTMAVSILRIPALLDALSRLGPVLSREGERGAVYRMTSDDQAALIGVDAELADISMTLEANLDAAYRGNPDGRLHQALAPAFGVLLARSQALQGMTAQMVATGTIDMPARAAARRQIAATDAAIDEGWRAAQDQLDRLLQARITATQKRIISHLVIAVTLLCTTLTLVLLVAGSIAAPIGRLANVARRVRQSNDYTLRAEWESRDEIGDLVVTFNAMLDRLHTENLREQALIGRTHAAEAQRSLIERIPVPLIVWQRADRQLLHVNPAAGELLGLKLGAGDGLGRWITAMDRDRLLAQLNAQGAAGEFTASCLDASGEQLWAIISALEIKFQEQDAILATVTPINEQRRIEGELRAAKDQAELAVQELREAQKSLVQAEKLASLGALVAGVAHEINTPIGIALTGSSMLTEETEKIRDLYAADGMTQEAFEEFLSVVTETAGILVNNMNRATALIQSFKRVAVDRTSAERRSFLLSSYMHEILQTLGPRLRATKVGVSLDCPETLEIDGYPGALSQVITNLVLNSLTHGYDPGQEELVSISVEELPQGLVRLRLKDDGKGIAPEHLSRIFDPFFTTRRASGGSGLGLHIVYNLVSGTLQGQIDVWSVPGEGSMFTVVFPKAVGVT